MRKIVVSTALSRHEVKVTRREITWQQFKARMEKSKDTGELYRDYIDSPADRQGEIKDVGWFVTGSFSDNVRKGRNLQFRSCAVLDLDHARPNTAQHIQAVLANYTWCIYSSHKHSPTFPRLRLVIPLGRDVSQAEYEPVARKLAELIGIDWCDHTTFEHSRLMYWGSHSTDMTPLWVANDGKWIDPDQLLARYTDWTDRVEWPRCSTEQQVTHQGGEGDAQDPRTKSGPIGVFCRAYSVREAMDEFIPGTYEETGADRFTYCNASTTNGARLYNDGTFLFSDHESDPAFRVNCNSFDLVRIQRFGPLDVEGSMDSMMQLIRDDPKCQEEEKQSVMSAFEATGVEPTRSAVKDRLPGSDDPLPELGEDKEEPAQLKKDKGLIKQFLQRFIYVADGDLVCDLKVPPQKCMLKLTEFNHKFAGVRIKLKKGNQEPKLVPVSSLWMASPSRQTAHDLIYNPSKTDRLILDPLGMKAVNTFYMPKFEPTDKVDQLQVFTDHMEYLIPIEAEREWFIDWMAFNLQHPETRSKVTPLHISRETGTGRGWICELMAELLGMWNCTKTKIATLMPRFGHTVYHDCFVDSLFCSISEVYEGGNKFEINDEVKDLLEEKTLQINRKFGKQGTVRVYTNFFLQSNHVDAVIIDDQERRINVFTGPETHRSIKYYNRLYQWLETNAEGLRQLHGWLLRRDLTDFDWNRSMDTQGRRNMILNAQSVTESLFIEWMADSSCPDYASQEQIIAMLMHRAGSVQDVAHKQVRKLIEKRCKRVGDHQIRIDGKKLRVWQIKRGAQDGLSVIKDCVRNIGTGLTFEDVG